MPMNALLTAILLARIPMCQAANVRLPDESAGVSGIVGSLVSAFDRADIVALGEDHESKGDSEVRIALVRDAGFARKVRSIVVEFGSKTEQATLDRYIRGEKVPGL